MKVKKLLLINKLKQNFLNHNYNYKKYDNLRIPALHILPKVHKNPIQSRPTFLSTSSMTYHTSVYENKLLPPFLKKIVTVCTSTQQLTLDMEI